MLIEEAAVRNAVREKGKKRGGEEEDLVAREGLASPIVLEVLSSSTLR